jgi:uncharacterized protein involved in outer membrane biogenesis
MKKLVIMILAAGLLLVAALAIFKNQIIESVVRQQIRSSTGLEMEVESLRMGLLSSALEIRGLKLMNPPDFPDREAFDISRIHARYSVRSLFSTNIQLPELVVEVPRVVLVRKADGESNLERVKDTARRRKQEAAAGRREPAPPPTEPPAGGEAGSGKPAPAEKVKKGFFIGSLTLRVGTVEMRDYGRLKDGKPKVKEYDLALDRTFEKVDGIESVVSQMVNEIIMQEALKSVSEQLADPETMKKLDQKLDKAVEKLGKKIGGLLGGGEKAAP